MTGFPRFWLRRGPAAALLLPAGLVFFFVSWVRRALHELGLLPQTRVRVPVIVVGNLVAGGTGKTPVVIALVAALRAAGFKPGVISRGYGGSATHVMSVSPATDAAIAGDEPVLIARRAACPVWVGRSRAEAAEALLATDPECNVIVSDDGLQHYALARALEIAVFDERGIGNGWPIPAGPLREPVSRLANVDFLLYQGAEHAPVPHAQAFGFRLAGDTFHRVGDSAQTKTARDFVGSRVAAIAGIGNPHRFFAQLQTLGIDAEGRAFPDHHVFVASDLEFPETDVIMMTEKDAVKCEGLTAAACWALRVDAELPDVVVRRVLEKLNGP
jgi:tetraacyldisaccharide 4'-kinase